MYRAWEEASHRMDTVRSMIGCRHSRDPARIFGQARLVIR